MYRLFTIYRKHIRCILRVNCVYCIMYSVFAIHYKYIVEVLGKTIRRTGMIDHSFERKFHGACYRGAVDYGGCDYGECEYDGYDYGECDYDRCVNVRVWPIG